MSARSAKQGEEIAPEGDESLVPLLELKGMKILLVDDHALFRTGMRHLLKGMDDEVTILEGGSRADAERLLQDNPDIDLALLDLDMPGMNGMEGVRSLCARFPTSPMVIISAAEGRQYVQGAIDSGAMGYIPKASEGSILLNALKLVLSGGMYLPPIMAEHERIAPSREHRPGSAHADDVMGPSLTKRQRSVLELLVKGCTNKEIARALDLAEGTVRFHVSSVVAELGCANRTQAVAKALQLGLLGNG